MNYDNTSDTNQYAQSNEEKSKLKFPTFISSFNDTLTDKEYDNLINVYG